MLVVRAAVGVGLSEAARPPPAVGQVHAVSGFQLRIMPCTSQTFTNCGSQSTASLVGDDGGRNATPRRNVTAQSSACPWRPPGCRHAGVLLVRLRTCALIALGVPVIVWLWLRPESTVPYFRVVTGGGEEGGTGSAGAGTLAITRRPSVHHQQTSDDCGQPSGSRCDPVRPVITEEIWSASRGHRP